MTQTEPWTVGRLLTWTTDFLKSKGVVESPRLDAEVLLARARGCRRIDLYAAFNEPASEETRTTFRELVKRRSEGTPVAYLVGKREFYSLDFRVTPDVLIPRPETEHLVIAVLDRLKADGQKPAQVADIGTGSGAIAICVAKHAPQCHVTAVDISPEALAIAGQNAIVHHVADRIKLLESDLFSAVQANDRFDIIASNPPYITTAEMEQLSPSVREHEPAFALHAGPQGTETIERLIDESVGRLNPGGWLMMEISPMLDAAVRDLFAARPEWHQSPTIKDLAGHARVVQAQLTKS